MARKADQSFDPSHHRGTMSFGDHLDELRKRILWALAIPLPLMIVIFFLNQFFDNILIDWLVLPVISALHAAGLPQQLQVLSPTEMIVLQMKLCLLAALVLSAPWVLYQTWKFIEPGLYAHEKRFVHFLLPFSGVLSLAGLALLYFGMLPLMLRVLIAFGMMGTSSSPQMDARAINILKNAPVIRIVSLEELEKWRTVSTDDGRRSNAADQKSDLENPIAPQTSSGKPQATAQVFPIPGEAFMTWPAMNLHVVAADGARQPQIIEVPRAWIKQEFRLSEYVNLVLMLMLAIAIAFQMPLVIALLGWLGLASPAWLRQHRRYALLICGVVAVVITPPDALSALIMLVPLYGLYELGILLLVIAPASRVAQGRVFSWHRFGARSATDTGNYRREPMDQPPQTAQMERPVARERAQENPPGTTADGGGDEP